MVTYQCSNSRTSNTQRSGLGAVLYTVWEGYFIHSLSLNISLTQRAYIRYNIVVFALHAFRYTFTQRGKMRVLQFYGILKLPLPSKIGEKSNCVTVEYKQLQNAPGFFFFCFPKIPTVKPKDYYTKPEVRTMKR